MGAGGIPDVGAQAAMEDREKIMNVLKGADMVFITAGMGGGTGTGAAPIVAEVARELKALTVGVVTLPFIVEGEKRMSYAKQGQNNLRERVDTLITIPNEAIFKVIDKKTSVGAAYKLIDDMLYRAVRGISNIINSTGFVNVDFADVRTVMGQNGDAVIGLGEGTGENRVAEALQSAIHHPLLNGKTIDGAQAVLINVVGGSDFALYEYHEIQKQIHEQVSKDAVIIVGFTEDETKDNHVSITVIATGYRRKEAGMPAPELRQGMQPGQPQKNFQPQILPRTGTEDGTYRAGAGQQGLDFPRVDTSVQGAVYDIPTFLRKMPKVE
jgi:cell division protein FtsZ